MEVVAVMRGAENFLPSIPFCRDFSVSQQTARDGVADCLLFVFR